MRGKFCILGPCNLQNELLCRVLEKEIGGPSSILEKLEGVAEKNGEQRGFLFVDAAGIAPGHALEQLRRHKLCSSFLVALYNLQHGLGIEPDAIKLGVKGFFYEQDSLSMLLKGIKVMSGGEVWLSRRILVQALISGADRKLSRALEQNGLSQREIQLLVLVGAGASNKEISQKLFISENTVKTHMYNIFKKIKVPNRLQAALWVTKNLGPG